MTGPWCPCPTDFEEAPALAIVAALECAIAIADVALIADHPALLDSEPPDEHLDRAAHVLLSRLWSAHRAIRAYRAALDRLRLSPTG